MLSIAKDQNIKYNHNNSKNNSNGNDKDDTHDNSHINTEIKIIKNDDEIFLNPSAAATETDNNSIIEKNTNDHNNNLTIKSTTLVSGTEVSTELKNSMENENFLFQLQVLFGYLRLSEKRFYDTLGFCKVGQEL